MNTKQEYILECIEISLIIFNTILLSEFVFGSIGLFIFYVKYNPIKKVLVNDVEIKYDVKKEFKEDTNDRYVPKGVLKKTLRKGTDETNPALEKDFSVNEQIIPRKISIIKDVIKQINPMKRSLKKDKFVLNFPILNPGEHNLNQIILQKKLQVKGADAKRQFKENNIFIEKNTILLIYRKIDPANHNFSQNQVLFHRKEPITKKDSKEVHKKQLLFKQDFSEKKGYDQKPSSLEQIPSIEYEPMQSPFVKYGKDEYQKKKLSFKTDENKEYDQNKSLTKEDTIKEDDQNQLSIKQHFSKTDGYDRKISSLVQNISKEYDQTKPLLTQDENKEYDQNKPLTKEDTIILIYRKVDAENYEYKRIDQNQVFFRSNELINETETEEGSKTILSFKPDEKEGQDKNTLLLKRKTEEAYYKKKSFFKRDFSNQKASSLEQDPSIEYDPIKSSLVKYPNNGYDQLKSALFKYLSEENDQRRSSLTHENKEYDQNKSSIKEDITKEDGQKKSSVKQVANTERGQNKSSLKQDTNDEDNQKKVSLKQDLNEECDQRKSSLTQDMAKYDCTDQSKLLQIMTAQSIVTPNERIKLSPLSNMEQSKPSTRNYNDINQTRIDLLRNEFFDKLF